MGSGTLWKEGTNMSLLSLPLRILGAAPFHTLRWLRRRMVYGRKSIHLSINSETAGSFTQGSEWWTTFTELKRDTDLRTLVISISSLPSGWANIQAFRAELLALKGAGKSIFCFVDLSDFRALYIASAADKTWLSTGTEVFWSGIGGRHTFYGDLLAKLEVKADIVAAGEYKSFGESYTRNSASEANREQLLSIYSDLQEQYLEQIAHSKGLALDVLRKLMATSPLSVEKLQGLGLIEGECYLDELQEKVKEFTLTEKTWIRFGALVRLRRWTKFFHWGDPRPRIGLLFLDGAITENTNSERGIVAEETNLVFDYFMNDDRIKAVVLVVNSPGGSATASDKIARSVKRLRKEKPTLAYFGNVSASGGYYLSCMAGKIMAAPGTITGSIGVVGGKIAVGKGLEKYGIHGEIISSGPDSDMFDIWTPFSDEQRARFQGFLKRTYTRFLRIVSEGRTMPLEAVAEVAEGRVWTGRQALENGLVDELGTLEDAVDRICERSGLNPRYVKRVSWRKKVSMWRRLQGRMVSLEQRSLSELLFKEAPLLLQQVQERPLEALLLLPFDVEQ